MPHAGVNAAAVGIKAADDHVVEADECSEHAHRRDQPKRTVACDSERKPNDVGLARPPVAIKDCRRARNIDIARSLNVCWYQLIRLKRDRLARRGASLPGVGFHDIHCSLMVLTRLAVGLEPLNALDAAHRSPRSAALSRARNLGPPLDRPLADPLSETKNWRNLLTGRRGSQVSHSLRAHLERFMGDEAIPDCRLGLDKTWTCRITFIVLSVLRSVFQSKKFRLIVPLDAEVFEQANR